MHETKEEWKKKKMKIAFVAFCARDREPEM